jgi:hypothetical protein
MRFQSTKSMIIGEKSVIPIQMWENIDYNLQFNLKKSKTLDFHQLFTLRID